jgi:hypothetical protein
MAQSPVVVAANRATRRLNFKTQFWVAYAVAVVAGLGSGLYRPNHHAPAPAAPPVSAAWTQFHGECSQLWSSSGCACWERNLEAAAIYPDDAVDVLLAADAGDGQPWMVRENLQGNKAVSGAMSGCALG